MKDCGHSDPLLPVELTEETKLNVELTEDQRKRLISYIDRQRNIIHIFYDALKSAQNQIEEMNEIIDPDESIKILQELGKQLLTKEEKEEVMDKDNFFVYVTAKLNKLLGDNYIPMMYGSMFLYCGYFQDQQNEEGDEGVLGHVHRYGSIVGSLDIAVHHLSNDPEPHEVDDLFKSPDVRAAFQLAEMNRNVIREGIKSQLQPTGLQALFNLMGKQGAFSLEIPKVDSDSDLPQA